MLFGDKIKELRDENGVLQRQLANSFILRTPCFLWQDLESWSH